MQTNYWTGIQQIGIGIKDVSEASRWYRDNFGFTAQVFDDAGEAALMLPIQKMKFVLVGLSYLSTWLGVVVLKFGNIPVVCR